MVQNIRSSALQGIQGGLKQAEEAARRIATAYQPNGDGDIVEDAIVLRHAERAVSANSQVLKVAERLEDAILDILA